MTPVSDDNQADIIEAFNSTYRRSLKYCQSLFQRNSQSIYPPGLKLNKANVSDNETD